MSITRRVLLGSAAVSAIEPLSARAAVDDVSNNDTAFLDDLEAWRQAYDSLWEEEDPGPLWDAKCAIADRIMERPADTAIGLGVKLLVLTEYGEHQLECLFLDAVLEDAHRIVGIPMPSTMADWNAKNGAAS